MGSSCTSLRTVTSYTLALVVFTSWFSFIRGYSLVLPVVHCLETVVSCILSNFILFMVGRLDMVGRFQYWFICHGEEQKSERHFICALIGTGLNMLTLWETLTMCPCGGISSFPCFLFPHSCSLG